MQRSTPRLLILLGLVVVAVAAIALWPRRAPDADAARLTWIADAHQLGPVGYRDPAGAISPDGQWIAYAEGRFLRVAPARGGAILERPPAEAQIRTLAWHPGSRALLADGHRTPGGWAIYDLNARSRRALWGDLDSISATIGGATVTAHAADLRQPAWSRDGQAIAAVRNGREGQELWVVAATGTFSAAAPSTTRSD